MTAYFMQLYYFLTRRWSLSYWQTRAAALPQDLWHVDQEVTTVPFEYVSGHRKVQGHRNVSSHRVLSPRGAVIATFYGTPVSGLRQAVKYAERQNACYALSRQGYAEEPMGKCINCGELCFRSRGATAFHCEFCQTDIRYAGFGDKP